MRIVADENIPCVEKYFERAGDIVLKPGRQIVRDDLVSADILLVRAVTQVNRALLENTSIKFVGSATSGVDHIDEKWLNAANIKWASASGCNTMAVVQYVLAVVAAMQKMQYLSINNLRVGIIGVGKIGSAVAEKLKLLNVEILQYDPLRAEQDSDFISTPLSEFVNLDLVTIHAPLTTDGFFPTYHLVNKIFLQQQKKNCVLLNTSRGSVVDFSDLDEYGQLLYWCLDVWENEPYIDFQILQNAVIATPHIAGYSVQSKLRGVDMIYQAACREKIILPHDYIPNYPKKTISVEGATDWRDVVLKIYNPLDTTTMMKDTLLDNKRETFDDLRKNFIDRFEFEYVSLTNAFLLKKEDWSILKNLHISD